MRDKSNLFIKTEETPPQYFSLQIHLEEHYFDKKIPIFTF